jgi:hypothetical protein
MLPDARQFLTDDHDTDSPTSSSAAAWIARTRIGLQAPVKTSVTAAKTRPHRGLATDANVLDVPPGAPRPTLWTACLRCSRPTGSSRSLTNSSIHESLDSVPAGACKSPTNQHF